MQKLKDKADIYAAANPVNDDSEFHAFPAKKGTEETEEEKEEEGSDKEDDDGDGDGDGDGDDDDGIESDIEGDDGDEDVGQKGDMAKFSTLEDRVFVCLGKSKETEMEAIWVMTLDPNF